MKKLITTLLFLAALGTAGAQVTNTPNLNLQLPPYAYPNWNTIVNSNFSKVDTAYGVLSNPYQGVWTGTTLYSSGQIVLYNGNTYISLLSANTGNEPDTSGTYWAQLSVNSGGGGGGTGTVTSGPAAAVPSYGAVTGTTVNANPNLYQLNNTMTLTQVNAVFASLNCGTSCGTNYYGTVIIPSGVPQIPFINNSSQYGNTGTSVADFRVGMQATPMSTWGTVCDARNVNLVLTAGSTTVYPTNSTLGAGDIGKTVPLVGVVGGIPTAFLPTIVSTNLSAITGWSATSSIITIAATNTFVPGEPVSINGMHTTAYFNGFQYTIISASGSQFTFSGPGVPNTAFTADVGTATGSGMTLSAASPFGGAQGGVIIGTDNQAALQRGLTALAAGNLTGTLPAGCGMLTSPLQWNNGQSFVGQGDASTVLYGMPGMDVITTPDAAGLGSVTKQGLLAGYFTLNVNNGIDATKPWNLVTADGVVHNQQPYYRPINTQTFNTNIPTAPGWASWFSSYVAPILGVASITSGSATMCVPNALGRSPSIAAGNTITFRDTPVAYSGTVTSLTGSCSAGFSGATLSPAMPSGAGYTIAQAEWVSSAGTQKTASAIPAGTVAYPFTLTLANSIAPVPYFKGGFGTHGSFKVGSEQYYYQGINTTSKTVTVVAGPTTSAGWAVSTAMLPMNPCYADANVPYPVTPTINSGDSTPSGANYFPSLCAGNAGIAMPQANGNAFVGTGWSFSHLQDIIVNAITNNNSNNSAGFYFAGNTAPYNTTMDNFHTVGTTYGFVQGPASYGMHGVAAFGPTGAGNHITNCSFNAAYDIVLADFENSGIDTCNSNTVLYDQYSGATIGSATAFVTGYTLDEQTGALVTNVANSTFKDITSEPENGTHSEVPPYAMLDCGSCTYWNDYFEGAGTIVDGNSQIFKAGQVAGLSTFPNIIYGTSNEFDQVAGMNFGNINSNVYGSASTLDWGNFNRSKVYGGELAGAGPLIAGLAHSRASWDGNDSGSFRDGVPQQYSNQVAGYISAAELSAGLGTDAAPMSYLAQNDNTSPSGSSAGCNVTTGGGCFPVFVDGFGGGLVLGPTNRISTTAYKVTTAVQTPAGANTFVFSVSVSSNGGTCSYPLGHTFLSQTVTTSAAWSTVNYPVNLNDPNALGCLLVIGFGNSASNTLLKVGYVNFQPTPSVEPLQLATFTNGAACPAYSIPGDFIGSDATNVYMCSQAGTVKLLPFGGSGGGFTSPMTTLGDTLAQGASAAQRIAGVTSTQPGFLSETGTGTVSALPTWVSSSGTGSVCLTTNCQMTTPSLGAATATSITISGPQTGYAGYGTATFALGATAQVGTGATTPTCSGICDSIDGTVTFTSGTGTPTAGTILTITVPGVRTGANGSTYNPPTCTMNFVAVNGYGNKCQATNSSGVVTLTISVLGALSASESVYLTYHLGGI